MNLSLLLCLLLQFTGTHSNYSVYCTRTNTPQKVEDLVKGEVLRDCVNMGMGTAIVEKVASLMEVPETPVELVVFETLLRGTPRWIQDYPQFGIRITYLPITHEATNRTNTESTHLTPEHLDGGIGP